MRLFQPIICLQWPELLPERLPEAGQAGADSVYPYFLHDPGQTEGKPDPLHFCSVLHSICFENQYFYLFLRGTMPDKLQLR